MGLDEGLGLQKEIPREKAEVYIDKEKQLVLKGSPPCTPFSQLQSLNPVAAKEPGAMVRTHEGSSET